MSPFLQVATPSTSLWLHIRNCSLVSDCHCTFDITFPWLYCLKFSVEFVIFSWSCADYDVLFLRLARVKKDKVDIRITKFSLVVSLYSYNIILFSFQIYFLLSTHANRQGVDILLSVCFFFLFVRLRISLPRIKPTASHFARQFIAVQGRESQTFVNFALPEAQNRTNRPACEPHPLGCKHYCRDAPM